MYTGWIYAVALFMLLQVLVIIAQSHVDPAFFLPQRMARVQTYDYHPPLPLPDPEAPDQSLGDCAICMDAIVVDPTLRRRSLSGDGKEGAGLGMGMGMEMARKGLLGKVAAGGRKTYSLAPCHHLFVSRAHLDLSVAVADSVVDACFLGFESEAHCVSGEGE